MAKARVTIAVEGVGLSINSSFDRSSDQGLSFDPTIPRGKAGTLSTRTDNDDGVATLGSNHGLVQGDLIDLYWASGLRRGVTVDAVTSTTITITGGSGDNLPAQSTAVVASKIVVVTTPFDSSNVPLLALHAKFDVTGETSRVALDFRDGSSSVAPFTLVANKARLLDLEGGASDPFSGTAVTLCRASNGSSDNDCTLQIIGVQDATT